MELQSLCQGLEEDPNFHPQPRGNLSGWSQAIKEPPRNRCARKWKLLERLCLRPQPASFTLLSKKEAPAPKLTPSSWTTVCG
ncbi:hypothetical protein LDENG_00179170 [Lucifuga dentata]|nr:hypothetical protein LDENG_00179170 [Lucifuga dentata]